MAGKHDRGRRPSRASRCRRCRAARAVADRVDGRDVTAHVAVLAEWNFAVEANAWVHWPGPVYEKNPQPEIWALYDAIGRGS